MDNIPSKNPARRAQLKPQSNARGPKPGQLTEQQKLIGYGVLGLGVLAVLAVGWIALSRTPRPEAVPAQAQVETNAPPVAVSPQPKAPEQEKIGRVSGISERQIKGTWSVQLGDVQAIFQIGDGVYQILAARSQGTPAHYYSRGTYMLEGDLLTMTPVGKMGVPESDDPAIRYTRLMGRPFSVVAGISDGRQVWLPGPSDPQFPNRSTLHPLILMGGGGMVVWQKTKD